MSIVENNELMILRSDKQYVITRIKELEKQIQDLGPEFYDAFNQSSETWHDNAPFDALRDKQSVLDAELQGLKKVLRNTTIVSPKHNKSVVETGCYVTLADHNNKLTKYFIAGDWTPFAGNVKDGATIVSRAAPIAKILVGHKVNYSLKFRNKTFVITSIEYTDSE